MSTTPPITDQRDQPEQPQVSDEQRDSTVLNLMLCESDYPWSVEELARTIEDRTGVIDAVCRLAAAGLVHRIGEFVFPTLAARRADELGAGV